MANYFTIKIKSQNVNAIFAAKLLEYIRKTNLIEEFHYTHSYGDKDEISTYTRGFPDIGSFLEENGILEEEVVVEDEFEAFWKNLTEEEKKEIINKANSFKNNCVKEELTIPEYDWAAIEPPEDVVPLGRAEDLRG